MLIMLVTEKLLHLFACKALLNEAQAKLVEITHDQNHYKSLLESLVEQVTAVCCLSILLCHISINFCCYCVECLLFFSVYLNMQTVLPVSLLQLCRACIRC